MFKMALKTDCQVEDYFGWRRDGAAAVDDDDDVVGVVDVVRRRRLERPR